MKCFFKKVTVLTVLAVIVTAIGCKQTVSITEQKKADPQPQTVTITVAGGEHVTVKEQRTFTVAKGETWKTVQKQVHKLITYHTGYEAAVVKLNNKDGQDLRDVYAFTQNTTVFVLAKAKGSIAYTVEHWQQNIKDDDYTKVESDTETKHGITDADTAAVEKNYLGFTAKAITQQKIKGDGTTVVEIKYDRKEITLTLNLDDGSTTTQLTDGTDGTKLLKGRYGATVTLAEPTKTGYTFTGWNPALLETFQEAGSSHTAQWKLLCTITITGDERTNIQSGTVITGDYTQWSQAETAAKQKAALKSEWNNGDYALYEWRLNGKDGQKLTDEYPITGDITVYAVTNYTKFSINDNKIRGYSGNKPRGDIIIPENAASIDREAFEGCTGITHVDLSGCTSLEKIDENAFADCTGLTDIKLPKSLTKIGWYVFKGCTGLTSVDLSDCTDLTRISWGAFKNCTGLTDIKLPKSLTRLSGFSGCTGLTRVNLSGYTSLTEIKDHAFDGCTSITEITLPENLTRLSGFSGCTGLTRVDLSGYTKLTMMNMSFKDCTRLTEVKLPKNLTEIGYSVFHGCTALKEIQLPEGVTTIEDQTFYGCTSITEVTLPASLTEMGQYVFEGCSKLTKIVFTDRKGWKTYHKTDYGTPGLEVDVLFLADSEQVAKYLVSSKFSNAYISQYWKKN